MYILTNKTALDKLGLTRIVQLVKSNYHLVFIVLIFSFLTYYLLRAFMRKFVYRKLDKKRINTMEMLLGTPLKLVISIIALVTILQLFKISLSAILAVSTIGTFAIGFGAKKLMRDIITGIFIIIDADFIVGDIIEIDKKNGRVEEIGIRTMSLRNVITGEKYIFPNSEVTTVKNFSKKYRRAVIKLPIPYEVDYQMLIGKLEKALSEYDFGHAMLEKPIIQGTTGFDSQGIILRISCKAKPTESWELERDLRFYIKNFLDEQGISLSYVTSETSIVTD